MHFKKHIRIRKFIRYLKWYVIFPLFKNRFRNAKLNRQLIRKYGGKNATEKILVQYKKSDTLFILAAGQTINNLNAKQWQEIKQHDSIGINGFAYHDHVPTFHSFELENQHIPQVIKMFRETSRIILDKIDEYKKTAIIFRQHPVNDHDLQEFIKRLKPYNNIYWNIHDVIPGQSIDEYQKYLKNYHKIGLLDKDDFFPNKGSSLSWVISFAYKLKYKKIIFCGVDLFGDHFYVNSSTMDDNHFKDKISSLHLTGDTRNGNRIGIQEIIDLWNREFFIPQGTKLFCGSKYSMLSEFLPVYWK